MRRGRTRIRGPHTSRHSIRSRRTRCELRRARKWRTCSAA